VAMNYSGQEGIISNPCAKEAVRKCPDSVIARNVFGDEAISSLLFGDCFGKKRLTMTVLSCFRIDTHTTMLSR